MNKRKCILFLIDIAIIVVVCGFLTMSFNALSGASGENLFFSVLMYSSIVLFIMPIRCIMRVYSSIWRYASVKSTFSLVFSDLFGGILFFAAGRLIKPINIGFFKTVICLAFIMFATLISRLAYQAIYASLNTYKEKNALPYEKKKINVAIVGAGNVGTALAEELLRNPKAQYEPVFFIDTDKRKIGNRILTLKIYDDDNDIFARLKSHDVQEVIIALPDASPESKLAVYEHYKQSGCKIMVYDYASGNTDDAARRRTVREFKIEDLLFRDAIVLNISHAKSFYKDKVVLVTGGGGSIGSELCRQIAKCEPKKLIILDFYENNAYSIQQELIREYGKSLDMDVVIASVREAEKIDAVFCKYKPEIVFHAAAHKHVPLMESCPEEAVKNNIFGTYNVANSAEKYGTDRFILISTDKAVNPTSVMGASKRMCEMIVQSRNDSKTKFTSVRFGNVLGSNGSVIPLFEKQIRAGGPITITDKRIVRYFMTIPEAVSLVMETGIMAKNGELFVLDMGKPVKILDLAEKMIRLFGLIPYKDIKIEEIGLRPGEKLYEELLIKTEEMEKTSNNMIFIERDRSRSREEIENIIFKFNKVISNGDCNEIIDFLFQAVATYNTENNDICSLN